MKRLCLFLLPLLASPCWAQTAPALVAVPAGEIALRGVVQSVDAAKNELVLLAREFRLPSGKVGNIAPPKRKVVRFGGGSAPAVGQEVGVVGHDRGTGQPLEARDLVTLGMVGEPAKAKVPDKAGALTFPVEGQSNGWRITATGWSDNGLEFSLRSPDGRTFGRGSTDSLAPTTNEVTVRFLSPLGLSSHTPVSNKGRARVEFLGLDPALSPEERDRANGIERERVDWTLPALDFGSETKLSHIVTVPSGVGVEVQGLQLSKAGEGAQLRVRFHREATGSAPDAVRAWDFPVVVDKDGNFLWSGGGTTSETDVVSVDLPRFPLPPDARLRFSLVETRRSLAGAQGRFRLALDVPLPATPPATAPRPRAPFLDGSSWKTAGTAQVRAILGDDGQRYKNAWFGAINAIDKSSAPTIQWFLLSGEAWDEAGRRYEFGSATPDYIPTRTDGTPALANEWSSIFGIVWGDAPRPKILRIKTQWSRTRALKARFRVRVPVPQSGEIKKLE